MATESWSFDSVSLTSGNFALLELAADPPRERQNWITAADSESAALFRQPLHENRTITMKIRVTSQASMNAALAQVGAIVDKLRKASSTTAGVPLVWTPGSASLSVTFTVLTGEIVGLPISLDGDGYSWVLQRPMISLELTCQPYGVGARVVYGSTTTNSTPFQVLELPTIPGDIDALGELIVTDAATQSRRHVEWGLEGPLTYNAATSLLIDSDDMVTSGFSGAQATTTGAYDPNAAGNNSVSLTLVAGTTTAIAGTGNLSHVGVFRVKARIQSGSLSNEFRLSWKALDGPMNHNAWVLPLSTTDWQELDLGTITIPAATLGTQRWTGQVEIAAATSSPGTAVVDYLVLVPQADGYGVARSAYTYSSGIATGYDAFVGTTAGVALGVRAAPLGGSWATSGDATDFAFADQFTTGDTVESIIRSTVAAETNGRFAILGSTSYTDSQVDVRARFSQGSFNEEQTAILRWTDSSNYLRLVSPKTGLATDTARIEQVVAGVVTVLASSTFDWTVFVPDYGSLGLRYRLRFIAYASGRTLGFILSEAGDLLLSLDASSTAIATGGTLATGKPGLRDRATSATGPVNRYFTEFSVSTPAAEPIVIYSGRNLQIRYDDTLRQDSTGTYSGRPQSYNGSRFLLPPGTSRILAKARRNDIVTAADANVTDSTTIQVAYSPRYLAVPR
jgi:hypothetical protein